MDAETVERIVSRDDLCVGSESQILTALARWSVFECLRRQLDVTLQNQRNVLDQLVWHVRFLATPMRELWENPLVAQFLTESETDALLLASRTPSTQLEFAAQVLPEHIRAHFPRIAQPRKYGVQLMLDPSDESMGSPPTTCRKSSVSSGLTEKIFVGLHCIFE